MAIGLRERFFARFSAVGAPQIPTPKSTRIDALDGIRGISIAIVVIAHCGWDVGWWAAIGVDSFFVLSGYLITALLLDERVQYGRVSLKNFYARRFLRLFPALMVVIAAFLVYARVAHMQMGPVLTESALALFYSVNWARAYDYQTTYLSHTWSLSLEEQFYFIWPVITLLIFRLLGRTYRSAILCALGALALAGWREWMEAHGASVIRLYSGLDTHGCALVCGATIAFYMPLVRRAFAVALAWISGLALLAVLVVPEIRTNYFFWPTVGLIVATLNAPTSLVPRVLSFAPLAWLGKISYGLYLYHFPVMLYLAYYHHWKPLDATLVGVPISLLVAALSYYCIERPCLRLKSRFRTGAVPDPAAQSLPESATATP